MAADKTPGRLVGDMAELGPAPRHADRGVLGQRVVGAGEHLEPKRFLTHPRIEGAEGARRGALGGVRPVRLKVDVQVLGGRLPDELVGIVQGGDGHAEAAADVRRPG